MAEKFTKLNSVVKGEREEQVVDKLLSNKIEATIKKCFDSSINDVTYKC